MVLRERWFLAAVVLAGVVYSAFQLTPSSYGIVLAQLQAPKSGPVAGTSRAVRRDEWGLATPYFQATVRNGFQRVNETSFYREDLRNFNALPLRDWGLAFKPQMWAFFVTRPAAAFSIYFAMLMCGFVAGYFLLFRQLGMSEWLAAAAAVMLYCTGFVQFWWTTYGPLLAMLPWVLTLVLAPMRWWVKALLCAWAFPTLVLSHFYPTLLLTLAWGSLILILAVRPSVVKSAGTLVAVGVGIGAAAAVVLIYFADVIPIMRNTVYPGRRVSPAGTASPMAVISQLFPFLTFRLGNYQELLRANVCELSAVGSFLPILTLCAMRYKALREHAPARRALMVLLAGFVAITLWELAPMPNWIGAMLLWNTGPAERWMFTSGLLLTIAALVVWSNGLVELNGRRIALFLALGPVASVVVKMVWLAADRTEMMLSGLAVLAGIVALRLPEEARARVLVGTVVLMNVYGFGRFNPLQPAGPIFDVPETAVMRELRTEAAEGPLLDRRFYGSSLNGLGFRSVPHILAAPRLEVFRQYFPTMDAERFNFIFNRYLNVRVTPIPIPTLNYLDLAELPAEAFVVVRNVRRVEVGPVPKGICSMAVKGGIAQVSPPDATLSIEGWAPWMREADTQGIRVLSARSLRVEPLVTVTRPDIAEQMQDYQYVKAGFQLRVSSADGKILGAKDVVLVAFGTARGAVRLPCCGCP